jgi:hypothetical protein
LSRDYRKIDQPRRGLSPAFYHIAILSRWGPTLHGRVYQLPIQLASDCATTSAFVKLEYTSLIQLQTSPKLHQTLVISRGRNSHFCLLELCIIRGAVDEASCSNGNAERYSVSVNCTPFSKNDMGGLQTKNSVVGKADLQRSGILTGLRPFLSMHIRVPAKQCYKLA